MTMTVVAVAVVTVAVVAVMVEVGCNGLKREWKGFDAWKREGNDRLDSNQHFTACKTAPFRNIASSVPAPLNSA